MRINNHYVAKADFIVNIDFLMCSWPVRRIRQKAMVGPSEIKRPKELVKI
jgi:hypothetical protein